MEESDDARSDGGVQSIDRALEIVRILAFSNTSSGMRFSDLQIATGLSKGTLHRILKTLCAQRFVEQDASTRLYFLGMDFLALGARAANRSDIQALARASLVRLAKRTGDTVALSVRSGNDAVCVDRQEGNFPIKTLTLNVGTRRPLGVGSGSMALLAALPDAAVRDIVRRNSRRLTAFPTYSVDTLLTLVDQTRRQGYAFNDGRILRGMSGIALPILGARQQPLAAISIAAINDRMNPGRRAELVSWITDETQRLSTSLGGNADSDRAPKETR
jgi:DNA-binding IclR family transcriptional regulator